MLWPRSPTERSSNFGEHDLTAVVDDGDPDCCAGTMAPSATSIDRPKAVSSPYRILRAKIGRSHTGREVSNGSGTSRLCPRRFLGISNIAGRHVETIRAISFCLKA